MRTSGGRLTRSTCLSRNHSNSPKRELNQCKAALENRRPVANGRVRPRVSRPSATPVRQTRFPDMPHVVRVEVGGLVAFEACRVDVKKLRTPFRRETHTGPDRQSKAAKQERRTPCRSQRWCHPPVQHARRATIWDLAKATSSTASGDLDVRNALKRLNP